MSACPSRSAGFIAAIVGGFGRPLGAFVGGILLGLAQAVAIVVFGAGFKNVAALSVLLLFLFIRPAGFSATPSNRPHREGAAMDTTQDRLERHPLDAGAPGRRPQGLLRRGRDRGAAPPDAQARAAAAQPPLRADRLHHRRPDPFPHGGESHLLGPGGLCTFRPTSSIGARWSATSPCSTSTSSRHCAKSTRPARSRHDRSARQRRAKSGIIGSAFCSRPERCRKIGSRMHDVKQPRRASLRIAPRQRSLLVATSLFLFCPRLPLFSPSLLPIRYPPPRSRGGRSADSRSGASGHPRPAKVRGRPGTRRGACLPQPEGGARLSALHRSNDPAEIP